MRWSEPQLAMLREMGIRLWVRPTADDAPWNTTEDIAAAVPSLKEAGPLR